jgi:Ala-tRNA(Pro) deacylase
MTLTHTEIADQFTSILEHDGIAFELLPHAHAETARAEADAVGASPDEVAKTVVVVCDRGFVRALVPASRRLDLRKLAGVLERRRDFRLATEAELAAGYRGFAIGSVPPLGGRDDDCVVLDRRLAHLDSMLIEAGTHDESVRLRTRDLIIETASLIADICED